MMLETAGTKRRGCLKKTWWDCVGSDMKTFGCFCEDTQDPWRLAILGLYGKCPLKECIWYVIKLSGGGE